MKKLLLFCLLSFFTTTIVSAQLFQWAKKQENTLVNSSPGAPFNPIPIGGNYAAAGNNLVAETGLINGFTSFGNQKLTSTDSLDSYLAVHDQIGNLLWVKQITGGTPVQPSLAIDKNDNIFISGFFMDSLNIGGSLFRATTAGKAAVYIIKFDPAGNLLWARSSDFTTGNYGSYNHDCVVSTDDLGNVFVAGTFAGSLIFNGTSLVSGNQFNTYLVKYAANGNFQWASSPPLSGFNLSLKTSTTGSVYLSKSRNIPTYNFEHTIVKLDPAGAVLWNRSFRNSNNLGVSFTLDNIDNAYVTGYYSANILIGTTSLTTTYAACFLAKLDAGGNWKWARTIASVTSPGSPGFSPVYYKPHPVFTSTGQVAIAGHFSGITQFPGSSVTTPPNSQGTFVARLDTAGTVDWVTTILKDATSQSLVLPTGLATSPDGNFYIKGKMAGTISFGTIPLTSTTVETSFLTKITNEANQVTGRVYMDANHNGTFELGEKPFPELIIGTSKGAINGISAPDGTYSVYLPAGNSVIALANPPRHYVITPASHTVSFTGLNQIQSGKDFALQPVPNSTDACVTVSHFGPVRLGREFKYRLTFKNLGTTVLADTLKFTFNTADLNYVSSSVAPTTQSPGRLTWYYQNLQPNETRNIDVTFLVATNSVVGTQLTANGTINPVGGDLFPADNAFTITHPIIGPYDPNDKQVDKPLISPAAAANGEFLNYTIRFQNVGTDTAFTVVITDKISTKLNLANFEMLSASHPYKLDLKNNNTLEWRFNNILLPDSGVNEPASHGFIRFRIKTKPGLVIGDSIANQAAIYFDYNAPVITNYAVTRVANPTGIKNIEGPLQAFKLYPNPADSFVTVSAAFNKQSVTTIRLITMLGQVLKEVTLPANNQIHYQLPLNNLPKGVYVVQLETEAGRQTQRLVIQ